MRIKHGVEMLEVPANVMGSSSVFNLSLLWEDDTVILVDAGIPGLLPQIREAMSKTGVPLERITHIILTHHDIDHIGGVASICKELPGLVNVLAYKDETDYIEGTKTPLKLAQLEANLDNLPPESREMYEKLKRGFQNSYVEVDQALTDGEVLPYCGGIRVIHTPGHTLGHICLYLMDSKTLIAGDALNVEDGVLGSPPPRMNYDMALCKQSLQKLAQLDVQTVICYHGGIYKGPAQERIAEIADSIAV